MRKIRILTYIFLVILFISPFIGASNTYMRNRAVMYLELRDSVPINTNDTLPNDSVLITDSLTLKQDSIGQDSIKEKKPVLDAIVNYKAKDSIVISGNNIAYLFGDGDIVYNTPTPIKLKAEKIKISMDSNIVTATFGLDSIGKEFGYPVFNDGGTEYESKTMRYNFKTKKGFSQTTITQQGEGHVTAERAKMNDDNTVFIKDGKYTTCDHPHPHFYLNLTKAKVEPGKRITTGPAYLVIEDLPLPFAIPFGFFPFTKKYSSGVIMPSYGDELEKGFALRDGGYYFAINDNIDLKLTGEIYTKGSWAINAQSSYRKRYKYSGSYNLGYQVTKLGDKGLPDYMVSKDFKLSWSHTQDPKSNMYRTLSANVNFSTSSYDRNNTASIYNSYNYTNSTRSSTVNISQRIPNSPWSFNASANVNQTTKDSMIAMTLPNLTITMSRIYPFKKKERVGSEKWYEKISLSYSGDFRNSINVKENKLFDSNLNKDWTNGMQHRIPVQATFNLFNYLNITPAFNYTERWYTKGIKQRIDGNTNRFVPGDTINGFKRVYDFNFSLGFSTKLYGFYTPLIGGDKVKAIRHVFTPTISFSAMPDFSDPKYGFYDRQWHYNEGNGRWEEYVYSPYSGNLFGTAPKGRSGSINFSFQNNLEMKVKSESDSIGEKKISLIDDFTTSFSYNMVADSFKWSDINTNIRLKLSKTLTVNIGATWDPYTYRRVSDPGGDHTKDQLVRQDKLRISGGKGIGRLMRTGFSISPSINQDTVKKWFGKGGDSNSEDKKNPDGTALLAEGEEAEGEENTERASLFDRKQDDGEYDSDGYLKNEVKWSLSFNYSVNYAYSREVEQFSNEYKRKLTHNFSLNGSIQPTKNWNFTFNTSYDFDQNKFAYLNCSLTRNLHCWSISASFVPIGPYKSYFISLRATSSMLQDLKYEKRGRASSYDPEWDNY
jgi:lipopolysaccharide assembly outer membrane protein LptD (OstA)